MRQERRFRFRKRRARLRVRASRMARDANARAAGTRAAAAPRARVRDEDWRSRHASVSDRAAAYVRIAYTYVANSRVCDAYVPDVANARAARTRHGLTRGSGTRTRRAHAAASHAAHAPATHIPSSTHRRRPSLFAPPAIPDRHDARLPRARQPHRLRPPAFRRRVGAGTGCFCRALSRVRVRVRVRVRYMAVRSAARSAASPPRFIDRTREIHARNNPSGARRRQSMRATTRNGGARLDEPRRPRSARRQGARPRPHRRRHKRARHAARRARHASRPGHAVLAPARAQRHTRTHAHTRTRTCARAPHAIRRGAPRRAQSTARSRLRASLGGAHRVAPRTVTSRRCLAARRPIRHTVILSCARNARGRPGRYRLHRPLVNPASRRARRDHASNAAITSHI